MSNLSIRRAEAAFDALVVAGDDGLTHAELFDALVAAGVCRHDQNHQVIGETICRLRKMLAGPDMAHTEVVPCRRAAHQSRYYIAPDATVAKEYRNRRCGELAVNIATLTRQVQTEHDRFSGTSVFTDAAVDYLRAAVRELERAGAIDVTAVA